MKQTFLIILSALTILSSCKKDEETIIDNTPGAASITFDAVVGSEDFALGKDFTVEGKTYNFKMLRYWVSNVVLVKSDGTEFSLADSYFLIEETPALDIQDGAFTYPAKKRESVSLANVPNGEYTSVKFSIGVASKYNDNLSLQAGELSQLSGMTNISWMWHTSYIFSALHGKVLQVVKQKTLLQKQV